jgi:hypothetical protein
MTTWRQAKAAASGTYEEIGNERVASGDMHGQQASCTAYGQASAAEVRMLEVYD